MLQWHLNVNLGQCELSAGAAADGDTLKMAPSKLKAASIFVHKPSSSANITAQNNYALIGPILNDTGNYDKH